MANGYKRVANALAWELADKLSDMTTELHLVEGVDTSARRKGLRIVSTNKESLNDRKVVQVPSWTPRINLVGKTWEDVCDSIAAALETYEVIETLANDTKED